MVVDLQRPVGKTLGMRASRLALWVDWRTRARRSMASAHPLPTLLFSYWSVYQSLRSFACGAPVHGWMLTLHIQGRHVVAAVSC